MKELDKLMAKCVQAIKDVDTFINEHYDELLEDMKRENKIPDDWDARIICQNGMVSGSARPSIFDSWYYYFYADGTWGCN